MLAIDLPVGVLGRFKMLAFTIWFAYASTLFVVPFIIVILDAFHAAVVAKFVVAAEARPSASTSTRSFIMSGERVSTCKTPSTLVARVWPFACVKLCVAFEVVQSAKPRLAGLTNVRLFLTVGQQVAFEVVVASKIRGAVRALVSLV